LAGCAPSAEAGAPGEAAGPGSPAAVPAPTPSAPAAAGPSIEVAIRDSTLQPVREAVPPIRVQVPGAGIDMSIVPVGVLPDGGMELPENVAVAGWYRFGPDPATDSGTTVVAAHVDSLRYGLGPFAALRDVAAGTEITLISADGAEHRYTVQETRKVRKEELPVDEVFDRGGPERLALITCGGTFDRETRTYSDNVIVIASPAE
ncbi:MAG TPA: class F sortase, partial [Naasia sp.]